jgi:hypothetical protein
MVQALNSTLVLSEVLEHVLEGVMRVTRAERGLILLTERRLPTTPSAASRASAAPVPYGDGADRSADAASGSRSPSCGK